MKYKILVYIFLLIARFASGQQNGRDSLVNIISQQRGDTNEVKAILSFAEISGVYDLDSSIKYQLQRGLFLAKKLNYPRGEAYCNLLLGTNMGMAGNYSEAVTFMFRALHIYKQLKDEDGTVFTLLGLQGVYRETGDYKNSLTHAFVAKDMVESNDRKAIMLLPGRRLTPLVLAEIGSTYFEMSRFDSAALYAQKAIDQKQLINGAEWNFPVYLLGKSFAEQGKYNTALEIYFSAIPLAIQNNYPKDTADIYNNISALYKRTGKLDSSIYYAKQVTSHWNTTWPVKILLAANVTLAQVYKLKGNSDSAIKYIELSDFLKDSIFGQEKQKEIQNITFAEQLKQQEVLTAQHDYKKRIQQYILIGGLVVLVLIIGILWHNNRNKQRAYSLLKKQKQETDIQKIKAENTLEELKSTQAQLIQSAKMASLGELTAGIAHEIQNPLNFVNNFSEVNKELIDEAGEEIGKGNISETKIILNDIKENEQKINHHGKRADAIVKGMLQHSRSSGGVKEPTNINALADEYLRLSYHGLRARDKSFNATLKTDFDESIGNINIIPQDIGRVVLNLINNAFYAASLPSEGRFKDPEYKHSPTVWVSTKKAGDKVLISVKDNGPGIPKKILDKIFQPFFTTKPTGQGTGLGLSLSYDIVKAHGGELRVETKESEGSEFIIQLPIS